MKLHNTASPQELGESASFFERARRLCNLAKLQEESGDFETARATIIDYWERVGDRPRVEGLDDISRAEVLLRAGALTGWIGSARQIPGAQEIAKDLISESASLFDKLDLEERACEARVDLGICYWREGALDEARITLREVLKQLEPGSSEQKLRALLNLAIVEKVSTRYDDALRIHTEAAPLFGESRNHALKGKFHNEFATVLKDLGLAQRRQDYIDRALVEYAAASFHFEEADHKRFLAAVENNLGFLYSSIRQFREAHEHLSRARSLALGLKDIGTIAQVDDTRARAYLAEGRLAEAKAAGQDAVRALDQGDESSLLAEALSTFGTALARLKSYEKAEASLQRSITVAHRAGDPERAGIAALTIVEELSNHLPYGELYYSYQNAASLLEKSQDPEIKLRLGECARRLLAAKEYSKPEDEVAVTQHANGNGTQHTNGNGSFHKQTISKTADVEFGSSLEEMVLHYEGHLIKQALETSGGSVTRAARLLGITHQGLAFILNGRQKALLCVRTPVKARRRSIIRYR